MSSVYWPTTPTAGRPTRLAGRMLANKTAKASDTALRDVGIALKAALIEDRSLADFRSALDLMRSRHPGLAEQLGL